jgi:MATE family multidrug resistance protein
VSTAFVGNLTKEALAAADLASVWMNIGNTTLNGSMTAVDTLLNQSYGAKKYAIYGMWTANSFLFVSLATVLFSGYMFLCGPFMRLLGLDDEIAHQSGLFAQRLIPGLFPLYWFRVLTNTKYLQIQHILYPSVFISIMTNIVNGFLAAESVTSWMNKATNSPMTKYQMTKICHIMSSIHQFN